MAGTYGGKKERENMEGKKSGNIWREKDGGKKMTRTNGAKKWREKCAGNFLPAIIKIHRSCR
jgi:hypothetical protein